MKVVIVHGWDGKPEMHWYPWLKSKLNIETIIPEMPDTENPRIDAWVGKLEKMGLGEDTIFVGHSIGCQTILRYLVDKKAKGVVLVAPWMKLNQKVLEEEGPESVAIAKPWIETPIDWDKIDAKTVCIFSDNDHFVPLDNKNIFKEKLNAEIIVEHNMGHFIEEAGIKELPSALEAVKKMVG